MTGAQSSAACLLSKHCLLLADTPLAQQAPETVKNVTTTQSGPVLPAATLETSRQRGVALLHPVEAASAWAGNTVMLLFVRCVHCTDLGVVHTAGLSAGILCT